MRGQFLVGGVGDVVALRPGADRRQVDVDEHADAEVALMPEGHRLLDVREELQLVLDVFRREQRAVGQLADVLGAVDDLQMAVQVDEAGIARVHPAVRRLGAFRSPRRSCNIPTNTPGERYIDLAVSAIFTSTSGAGLPTVSAEDLAVGLQGDVTPRLRSGRRAASG
jgi:hypothetical protein